MYLFLHGEMNVVPKNLYKILLKWQFLLKKTSREQNQKHIKLSIKKSI